MNRAFDERFEIQLQDYEFAELNEPLPASHDTPEEDHLPAHPESPARRALGQVV